VQRTMRGRAVVQAVPSTRVYAIATTLMALAAFAVSIVFAQDRVEAVATPPVVAVLWGGGMNLMMSRDARWKLAPPLRIGPGDLPPVGSVLMAVIPGVALFIAFSAGVVAYALSAHQHLFVGFMLGVPIVIWDSLRKAKRAERRMQGTLWVTGNFAWTSKSRSRYLVART
jgi:hypothetical protein